jgi:hypothetical protein
MGKLEDPVEPATYASPPVPRAILYEILPRSPPRYVE